MAASACHITTDLSRLSLYDGSEASGWTAPEPAESDQPASAYRQRAQAAAQWLSQQGASAKRLSVVCVDTSESLCTWIQSRSPSYQVVASAYRDQTLDWGSDASSVAVEPILSEVYEARQSEHAKEKKSLGKKQVVDQAASARVSTAVITQHDALVRLWLDALDQRGIRPGVVISLWHALALAWADQSNSTSAVLYITENHQIIWCWSRNGDLLTGGTVASPRHAAIIESDPDETCNSVATDSASEHRLSLDWLSWGAHLGTFPESVKIIVARPTTLDRALKERFEGLRVAVDVQADPVGVTLERAAATIASTTGELGSRRCLSRLTKRPTRAVRRRYRFSAAALALASAALIGMSIQLQDASKNIRPVIAEYQQEQRQLLQRVPGGAVDPIRPVNSLQILINEKRKAPTQVAPPTPRPIFDELTKIVETCGTFEEAQVSLIRLFSLSKTSELRLDQIDRRTQLNVETALNEGGGSLTWSRRAGVSNVSLQLNGAWNIGGAN